VYIRPTAIATAPYLGVHASEEVRGVVAAASPVMSSYPLFLGLGRSSCSPASRPSVPTSRTASSPSSSTPTPTTCGRGPGAWATPKWGATTAPPSCPPKRPKSTGATSSPCCCCCCRCATFLPSFRPCPPRQVFASPVAARARPRDHGGGLHELLLRPPPPRRRARLRRRRGGHRAAGPRRHLARRHPEVRLWWTHGPF
jgi:hypothetical protein